MAERFFDTIRPRDNLRPDFVNPARVLKRFYIDTTRTDTTKSGQIFLRGEEPIAFASSRVVLIGYLLVQYSKDFAFRYTKRIGFNSEGHDVI